MQTEKYFILIQFRLVRVKSICFTDRKGEKRKTYGQPFSHRWLRELKNRLSTRDNRQRSIAPNRLAYKNDGRSPCARPSNCEFTS
jgi:hypothetical protein